VDALQVRVLQQCGQCGVWREIVTALPVAERHERTLEADRNAILRSVERVAQRRELSETDAFAAVLRDRVVGAEDLLALIPADTSARRDHNR
jgi:hypothetical protein